MGNVGHDGCPQTVERFPHDGTGRDTIGIIIGVNNNRFFLFNGFFDPSDRLN